MKELQQTNRLSVKGMSTWRPLTRHWPLATHCRSTGFTLIELILVMLILCTVLGLAGPSLRGFFGRRQIDNTASRLLSLTQYARSQAICEGRSYRLNIDKDRGTYWLTVRDQGAYEDPGTEWGRVLTLPTELSLELWDLTLDGSTYYVEFNSLGRLHPCTIQLVGPKGDKRNVTCRSVTESFVIVDGERTDEDEI